MQDDLALLTGPDARDLLAAALATSGEELVSFSVRQVDHRPGRSTTVAYDARVCGASGEHGQVLAASTGLRTSDPGPGVLVLSDGETTVAVWRFPLDPGLPGLPAATDEASVAALLASYGVATGPVELRVRTYRPRRRAVVEVRTPTARLFLKALRPHLVEGLHARHRLLREAGLPVPRSLGWSDDGLLVLEALDGTSLRTRMRDGGAPAPSGEDLLDVLDLLPAAVCELPRRRSWSEEARHYAEVVGAALPPEAERCRQLADRVLAVVDGAPATGPVHGDLYETQLLLDGARVCGLLDVDTAGPGRLADDLACLLAHAHVLAQLEPAHRGSTSRLGADWLTAFERRVDPAELRTRVAGVVLSLATGPHRVQSGGWEAATTARLDLAGAWLDSAGHGRAPVG